MSVLRLALGLAAATAAAVMYSNARKNDSGGDGSSLGMGRTPGTDRWSGDSEPMGPSSMGTSGTSMTGTDNDDLLSPSTAEAGMGGSLSNTPDRSGIL